MVNWAALGGLALGGVADAFGSSSAASAQKDMLKKALAALSGLKGEAGVAGQQQLQELRKALESIRGGYGQGLASIQNAGTSAEIGARDTYTQGVGEADQALLSRGMYDPQAMTSARRGYSSDLSRTLASIRESVGQARAQLQIGRGNAVAGAQGAIAGQIGANFDRRYNIGTDAISLGMSQTPTYQPQGANVGFLLGSLFGGGGGGKTNFDGSPYTGTSGVA